MKKTLLYYSLSGILGAYLGYCGIHVFVNPIKFIMIYVIVLSMAEVRRNTK